MQRSEDRSCDDRLGIRIAEPVADRYHAGDVPYLADQGTAERGGLRGSLHGDHAGLDRHPELARVDEELREWIKTACRLLLT